MKFSEPWTALKVEESYPLRNMHIAAITQLNQRFALALVVAFMIESGQGSVSRRFGVQLKG
jgi:hypothetical protein